MKKLNRKFYARDTVVVARELLGKTLVRRIEGKTLAGIINETEAYSYKDDPASHAFSGQTERNKAMFCEVGRSYVYFTYGMYYCFNVVARPQSSLAGAVLIRSILPKKGIDVMIENRKVKKIDELTNGPAKLSQAMKINKEQYGLDLTRDSSLFILDGILEGKIIEGPRIGIRKAKEKLWNFKIKI